MDVYGLNMIEIILVRKEIHSVSIHMQFIFVMVSFPFPTSVFGTSIWNWPILQANYTIGFSQNAFPMLNLAHFPDIYSNHDRSSLRVVKTQTIVFFEINVGNGRIRYRTTPNFEWFIANRFWKLISFKWRVILCRIRPFPTLISR